MPTKPLQTIIYREFATIQIKEILKNTTPLLQELVNYGSNALVRCATSSKSLENVDLASLSLYRHILEMTDAFEVLISNGCVVPTIPLLRSSFEALISIDYICEINSFYEQRSLSWLYSYVRDQIITYESLIPTSLPGKAFQSSIAKDKWLKDVKFPIIEESRVTKSIKNLEDLLQRKQFSSIEKEFFLLRNKTHRNPKWYSLYDGPKNLQSLSCFVRRNAQYDFLYRYWSRVSHAHDFHPFIKKTNKGFSGIREIRDLSNINEVAGYAAIFIIDATRLLLNKFRPTEDFKKYYSAEIRDRFLLLFKNK